MFLKTNCNLITIGHNPFIKSMLLSDYNWVYPSRGYTPIIKSMLLSDYNWV